MSNEIHRYRRFEGWDYTRGASLFITIVTEPRRALFGEVEDGKVILSPLGERVSDALNAIPRLNPAIRLFGRVVMPDHIHFNCSIEAGLSEPLLVLGNAIRRFKNYTTKEWKLAERSSAIKSPDPIAAIKSPDPIAAIKSPDRLSAIKSPCQDLAIKSPEQLSAINSISQVGFWQASKLWQQGYHDYILLSREMIDATERYIAYNPLKWDLMYGSENALQVFEPVVSPRLDAADWWKGVGNIALLAPEERLVSLRVSRKVTADRQIAELLNRMQSAVEKGFVIVSGFISPGERAVLDMLCQHSKARFIRILPSSIPNAKYKPESRYLAPFNEGRYLELAKGNNDGDFNRSACLNLNEEIIEIATAASSGLAIYWKDTGPEIVRRAAISGG